MSRKCSILRYLKIDLQEDTKEGGFRHSAFIDNKMAFSLVLPFQQDFGNLSIMEKISMNM